MDLKPQGLDGEEYREPWVREARGRQGWVELHPGGIRTGVMNREHPLLIPSSHPFSPCWPPRMQSLLS